MASQGPGCTSAARKLGGSRLDWPEQAARIGGRWAEVDAAAGVCGIGASMQKQLFESALGIGKPWFVRDVDFDLTRKTLTIRIDFAAGTRFPAAGVEGVHPVHDTQTKRLRHLNFFQHECFLEVRIPRVKLPDGRVVQAAPDWIGKLAGFTLLFEALVLAMAQQMTFAAVAKLVNESWHRVHAICSRYVDLALAAADLSTVTVVAIDETSCRRGHNYLTIAADTQARKVVFVTAGKDAKTIARFAEHLPEHNGAPEQIRSVSIDMSTAFIKSLPRRRPGASPSICPTPASPSTSSTSSPMRPPPSIRPGVSNSGPIQASRDCAGHCSRIVAACPPKAGPISTP